MLQSLTNMKEEQNQHFHSLTKKCEIIETDDSQRFCKTHQVKVCRCGWEIGWHYGTESKKLAVK